PRGHRRESLVDLRQRVRPRHERVELELAGTVERQQTRDVAVHVGAAIPAAEEPFLEEREEEEVERDGFLDAAEADDDAGPGLARRLERLLHRALGADRLERVVDAAARGESADRLDRIGL